MTIERDGRLFVLTPEELRHAYWEQENNYDIEDVKVELETMLSNSPMGPDEDEELELRAVNEILADDCLLRDCAYEKRRNIDKYGLSWDYAVREAVADAVDRRIRVYREAEECAL